MKPTSSYSSTERGNRAKAAILTRSSTRPTLSRSPKCRTQRPPTLTELYADGPFLGLLQPGLDRVIGDPHLQPEQNYQFDIGLRADYGWVRGGVTGVSMLLSKITDAPLAVWLQIVNAPFVVIGYRQIGVPYRRDPRYAGDTKYPTRKMVRFATDAITSFSSAPLRQ